ncbi:MAG: bifunctional hydroxymethylpyrimidine kinase/phosphomethylpyrimidine kinase [Rhodobiaceae bacterium]|nr:bifunctional hydroxymethylpyrimidine kinase/phosphomethylpyrimidine kinase [Rhodobiaceae bacterium]OUT93388.1 MAG: bifunctional hydroxymethylpyrimidine kinase/phosphomethylpyrimidine kinase [Rhizobiales bacterium TMED29]HAL84392.1 bifunctional hydroxymethylpyrimidine kinase/phosphomethylpyrimidine kinase [Rhodobiaceae bacterium]
MVVAGSDSGGGAGIQADIKSIMAQGAYATTAITALTAQNTRGVQDILDVPPAFVVRQITSVLEDIGTDIVKTGMLSRRALIEHVAQALAEAGAPMVVDPVMVATSGDRLLDENAVSALHDLLVNHAFLVTPNLPEATLLTRRDVDTLDDMKRAADTLMSGGAHAALIKGGHGTGNVVTDLLALQTGFEVLEHERLETRNTHGTGCTLASAIAGQLATQIAGDPSSDNAPDLKSATEHALAYVHTAIKNAPNLGHGNGPLAH